MSRIAEAAAVSNSGLPAMSVGVERHHQGGRRRPQFLPGGLCTG